MIDGARWPRFVDEWARRHREIDRNGLSDALLWAATFYSGGGVYESDTLNGIDEPATQLLKLLSVPVNWRRIIYALAAERGPQLTIRLLDEVDGLTVKFDEMLRQLEAVRLQARLVRSAPRRGRPMQHADLRAAYSRLAKFFKQSLGEDRFTQEWAKTPEGLSPKSLASLFLYEAMKQIDPLRPRLAQQLRALMAEDIGKTTGPRQGRKRA